METYAKFHQFIHNHVFSFYFRSFCTRFKYFWEYEHRHEFVIICSLPASGYMAHSLLLWKQYKNFRRICNYRFPIPDYCMKILTMLLFIKNFKLSTKTPKIEAKNSTMNKSSEFRKSLHKWFDILMFFFKLFVSITELALVTL